MRKYCFYVVGIFLACTVASSVKGEGTRQEYTIPFSLHGTEEVSLNAVLSCQALDVNKSLDQIGATDADAVVFLKKLISTSLHGEISELKNLVMHEGIAEAELDSNLNAIQRYYSSFDLCDFHLKKVVFVEDMYYLVCLVGKEGNPKLISYIVIKNERGEYKYDPAQRLKWGSLGTVLYEAFEHRFLNESQQSEPLHPKFERETIISPSVCHENYVSIKYNDLSFSKGIPVYDQKTSELLNFLRDLWRCQMGGTLDELAMYYDESSVKTIKKHYEIMGPLCFVDEQNRIKDGRMYPSRKFSYAVMADPITFVYYTNNDGTLSDQILYKDESGYRVIRENAFCDIRTLFKQIALKNIQ